MVRQNIIYIIAGTQFSEFGLYYYLCTANSILSIFIANSQFIVLSRNIRHLAILVVAAAVGFKFGSLNMHFSDTFPADMLLSATKE
jgi:hypothetical protein